MTALFRTILVALLLMPGPLLQGGPAWAQGIPGPATTPATTPAAPPPPPTIQSQDIQDLVATLKDDRKRQQLIVDLEAMLAARSAKPAPAETSPIDLLSAVGDRLQDFGSEVVDAVTAVVTAPRLTDWFRAQMDNADARHRWWVISESIGLILASAIAADLTIQWLLRPLRRRLKTRPGRSWLVRSFVLFLGMAADALPVGAFAIAAGFVLPLVHPPTSVLNIVRALIAAVLCARLLMVLARTILLAPAEAGWRLLPLADETANYLYIWVRRFVSVAIYGFALNIAAWWLGVPGAVEGVFQKLVALVLAVLAVIFVLQNRVGAAKWLRPHTVQPPLDGAEAGAEAIETQPMQIVPADPHGGSLYMLRSRFADIWHIPTIIYIVGIFAVFVLRVPGGFAFVFRSTLLTLLVFIIARLMLYGVGRLTRRGFAIPGELRLRFPTLETRTNRYLPVFNLVAAILVWTATVLSLFQVWGLGSYAWFTTDMGRRLTWALVTIGIILVLALGVWELLNAAIDRYLAGVDRGGNTVARSARMRTLLPLLRNAVLVVLSLIVLLLVLSELGINIAPLLAGAGVVGLAIGFGSQALVKDVITGLFMLIEDTIAIGEVVDLGDGHSGLIEAISIRTIRLRDQQGTVHTIPFSEISKIKNLAKDYGYWVVDIGVAYGADVDKVMALFAAVAKELRDEPAYGAYILEDLEPIGVNSFGASSVQVMARIKTLPLRQWMIGREFNRRIIKAFEANGLSMPFPQQTITFGEGVAEMVEQFRPAASPRSAPRAT